VVLRATLEQSTDREEIVRFLVEDTGIGLSETARTRLFQPFSQADSSTTRRYGGTGLGLVISKRLVEMMGGSIGVESVEGQGSTFWFTMPLVRVVESPPASLLQIQDMQPMRVLVVDGNHTHREIIQHYLKAWRMRSDSVGSAEEALLALREEAAGDPYTLALVDLGISGMDGVEFARAVRADRGLSDTRLVLLIDFNEQGRLDEGLRAGFLDHLIKPVRMSALLDTIARTLGQTAYLPVTAAVDSAPPIDPSQHLILVAEDNPVNQQLALLQIKKLGYQAQAVVNGREAVAAVANGKHALILMDVQMPELDGYGATEAIRNAEAQRNARRVPIIAMTANAMQGDRELCLAAGMDDYLSKPVKIEELKRTITHWLQAAPATGESGAGVPVETPDVPVLDAEVIASLRSLELPEEGNIIQDLVRTYLDDTLHQIREMRTSLADGDAARLRMAAHAVKGSSANLGAHVVNQHCRELEVLAQMGDLRNAEAHIAQIEAAFADATRALQAEADRR